MQPAFINAKRAELIHKTLSNILGLSVRVPGEPSDPNLSSKQLYSFYAKPIQFVTDRAGWLDFRLHLNQRTSSNPLGRDAASSFSRDATGGIYGPFVTAINMPLSS